MMMKTAGTSICCSVTMSEITTTTMTTTTIGTSAWPSITTTMTNHSASGTGDRNPRSTDSRRWRSGVTVGATAVFVAVFMYAAWSYDEPAPKVSPSSPLPQPESLAPVLTEPAARSTAPEQTAQPPVWVIPFPDVVTRAS